MELAGNAKPPCKRTCLSGELLGSLLHEPFTRFDLNIPVVEEDTGGFTRHVHYVGLRVFVCVCVLCRLHKIHVCVAVCRLWQ